MTVNRKGWEIFPQKGRACMLRIGMLTSGGDCQALNAAMRGVVKGICSKIKGVEIYGFKEGYKGLIYACLLYTSRCV